MVQKYLLILILISVTQQQKFKEFFTCNQEAKYFNPFYGTCLQCPGQSKAQKGIVSFECQCPGIYNYNLIGGDRCQYDKPILTTINQFYKQIQENGETIAQEFNATTPPVITCTDESVVRTYQNTGIQYCQRCNPIGQTVDQYELKVNKDFNICVCKDFPETDKEYNVESIRCNDGQQNIYRIQTVDYMDMPLDANTSTRSQVLAYYMQDAIYRCSNKDVQGCQILANLCVLSWYNFEKLPCQKYKLYSPSSTSNNGWNRDFPYLLFQEKLQIEDIWQGNEYQANLTFRKEDVNDNTVNQINYKLLVYDIEGNILNFNPQTKGFQDLTQQLFICPSSESDGALFKQFGQDFSLSCYMDFTGLMYSSSTTKFYQVFVEQPNKELLAVPVKVEQTKNSGAEQYVTRFTLIDNISGFVIDESLQGQDKDKIKSLLYRQKAALPKYLKYAEKITFNVVMKPNDQKIYLPYITVSYNYVQINQEQRKISNNQIKVEFKSTYNHDSEGFWPVARAIFITFNVFVGVLWLTKFYVWGKHNPQSLLSSPEQHFFRWLINGIFILIDLWADSAFYFLFFMTGYWFVFFKMQQQVYTLIPSVDSNNYYEFKVLLIIMYSFKLASFMQFVYKQLQVDVLFIDWENQKKFHDDNQEEENKRGISVWRTLFIANEFNELSTYRTISLEWSLFWVGFFLTGLNWINLQHSQPSLQITNVDSSEQNPVLRYFISCIVYIVTGVVQIIFRRMIIIWAPTQIQNFTDLCSVANISIFILDEQLHGYYLHGKSASGCSEGNSNWLKLSLDREAKSSNSRGLIKGDDLQTFEMFLPVDLRLEYNQEYKSQTEFIRAKYNTDQRILGKTVSREMFIEMEKSKQNDHIINVLKTYIKEMEIHHNNHVLMKGFSQRLLRMPPTDGINSGLPFFYRDPDMEYKTIFYCGNEWNILIFEMITYLFYDYYTESTLQAIFITYLFSKFFSNLRDYFGKRNISEKTMVDQRFLI